MLDPVTAAGAVDQDPYIAWVGLDLVSTDIP